MKKKILLFEGIDGSGKTSLLNEVASRLEQKGNRCKIISRDITPAASLISEGFIGLKLPSEAEICLRIAREYINRQEIQESEEEVFLLDRSIITIQAISEIHGLNEKLYLPLLTNLYSNNSFSIGLIFCTLPYQLARTRVFERLKTNNPTKLNSLCIFSQH